MGAVADAIERSARSFGAEIRTDARVARTIVTNGRVRGVVLESGEEILAPVVVTTLHPQTAFLDHIAPASCRPTSCEDIERWKTRSGVVKINLALSELPNFTADPGTELAEHHTGSVEMAPSIEYMERAFQDAREGRGGRAALQRRGDPDHLRQDAVPDGTHIMSLFTQWVPKEWSETPHTEELEAYADRMIDCYDEVAPNFKASILHRDVVGPYEMEHEYGLIGGNIFHGELSLEQLFHMRPAPGYADYRTPIKGLYNGSSATHAGGGVCGIPGWQAAKAALADQKAERGLAGRVRARTTRVIEGVSAPASGRRPPWTSVRAMLEPRRIAVVGASEHPGSFGDRLVGRGGPQLRGARPPPGQPALRHPVRPTVRGDPWRRSTDPSTWCCSGCRTAPSRSRWLWPPAAATARRSSTEACSSPMAARPCGTGWPAWPGRRAWPSAAAAAWDSSTWPTASGPSATSSGPRCRRARWPSSPTPGRCSRPFSVPGGTWASPSSSRPARSW